MIRKGVRKISDKISIKEAIIVEGKFDKERIKAVADAIIIQTNGFLLYKDKRIIESIKKFAKTTAVIVLTDSDRAGFSIRNYIKNCVGQNGVVKHAYIPAIAGKERRKDASSAEGTLGVEGMTTELLKKILKSAATERSAAKDGGRVTKQMFYEDGLSGGADSAVLRKKLADKLGLPPRLSANALVEIVDKLCTVEEYKDLMEGLRRVAP